MCKENGTWFKFYKSNRHHFTLTQNKGKTKFYGLPGKVRSITDVLGVSLLCRLIFRWSRRSMNLWDGTIVYSMTRIKVVEGEPNHWIVKLKFVR